MTTVIEEWQTYLTVNQGLAPSSRKLYGRTLEILAEDMGDPSNLSTEELRAWLRRKGGSSGTVSNRISALTSFYRYLVRTGRRGDDPSMPLEAPKHRKSEPVAIENLSQVLTRLDDIDRKANRYGATIRVGESRDMAVFLVETGLRINEAVACDWPVPCPPQVTVVGRGHKETTIAVSDEARAAWDRLGGRWPIKARATQRRFEKAGFNPQQLRHTHRATLGQGLSTAGGAHHGEPPDAKETLSTLADISSRYTDEELAVVISFLTDVTDRLRKPLQP